MQWFEAFFLFYLLTFNLISFISFGIDKMFAIRKRHRISESFLLTLTLLGGVFGSLLGMVLFHHKISKPKFRYLVPMIFILYFALLLAYFFQTAWGMMR